MTYHETVKLLRSYKEKQLMIEAYETKMYGVKAISYSNEEKASVRTDGLLINSYIQKVDDLKSDLLEIESLVEQLDGFEKYVIYNKFINLKSLEDVAKASDYSLRQIQRYYRNGILNLMKIMS